MIRMIFTEHNSIISVELLIITYYSSCFSVVKIKYPENAMYLQFQVTAHCLGEVKAATIRITPTNEDQSKNRERRSVWTYSFFFAYSATF